MVHTRSQDVNKSLASQNSPVRSSRGSRKDKIELNWILFDNKSRRIPFVISIPRKLYDGPSQHCQPLFLKELSRRCKVATEAEYIEFWTTKEPLSIKDAAKQGWAETINGLEDYCELVLPPQTFSESLVGVDRNHVHLVINVQDGGLAVGQSDVDVVPQLREFQRYNKTMLTRGMTPSEGAKSSGYSKNQKTDTLAIYDGRWTSIPASSEEEEPISTIAPPIQIFHPIFNDFIHFVDNPNVQPTVDDLKMVQDVMYSTSEVGRTEAQLSNDILPPLSRILQADVHKEPNSDGTSPDGVITLQIANTRIMYLILELKRELGEGGCDPTTQVGLSMKRSWIGPTQQAIREKCCCPTFLVAGGGPWLSVLGGIFTDKFIVQRLTDMRWMALSSTEEDSRVYHNARVFVALRKSLVKLRNFYLHLENIPPFVPNEPHPRYFPYPISFKAQDGGRIDFRYLSSLEAHSACVTYLAEILNGTEATVNPVKVVVKFVARYSKEVHELLAHNGYAPSLRYYGPLTDTELSGIFPGPAQSAPPGLCLRPDLMHMVVMDYIDDQPKAPPNASEQVKAVLELLHDEGYVFGDLRRPNILFDANNEVKFIDFNWCGRYKINIDEKLLDDVQKENDEKLPNDIQRENEENRDRVHVEKVPYARYPLSMSTVANMWAPGMERLARIQPDHDWLMFEKLLW